MQSKLTWFSEDRKGMRLAHASTRKPASTTNIVVSVAKRYLLWITNNEERDSFQGARHDDAMIDFWELSSG